MNITLNIQAETPEEIMTAVVKFAAVGGIAPNNHSDSKKSPSRSNKPGTSKPAEPDTTKETKEAAEPEKTPENQETDTGDGQEIPNVTVLRATAQEKGKTPEGKKAIKDLLNSFESKSISDIPEAKRAAFLAALEDL